MTCSPNHSLNDYSSNFANDTQIHRYRMFISFPRTRFRVHINIIYTIETHTLLKALLSCIAIPNQRSEQITADGGEISGEEAQDPQPD